jgi:CHAT domain-containing protein
MSFAELGAVRQGLATLRTANLARTSGERDDLLAEATLLEARARRLNMPGLVVAVLLCRAAILLAARRWRDVVDTIEHARPDPRTTGPVDLRVSALSTLAEAHAGLRRWPAANATSTRGIELVEPGRDKISTPYLRSSALRYAETLYRVGVRAAYELGDVESLLARAELVKARGVLRRLAPPDEDLHRRYQDVQHRLDRATGADADTLRAERRQLWDLLTIERLRGLGAQEPPVFRFAEVRARLAEDEAVVYYFWAGDRLLLVVTFDATRTEVEHRHLTVAQAGELAEDTARLVDLPPHEKLGDRFFEKWAWLLPDVEWLAEAKRLLVSPHQSLHALPFHALRRDGEYVIDRHAVTVIPNLASLLLSYRPAAADQVLAIGIGRYALPGVQPLPLADPEARAVAELYGLRGTGLYHGDATAARLRRWADSGRLARFSRVHLASHAENIPSDTPLEARLYLHDAVLDGLEIANWRLPADLVVLSACSAGQRAIGGRGLPGVPGDELFGLQAAFFAAGAHRIISPLWPVADDVGAALMTCLHRHLLTGCPPEVAHQRAVLEFRAGAGLTRRRPTYWAPYYLAAIGRATEETAPHD